MSVFQNNSFFIALKFLITRADGGRKRSGQGGCYLLCGLGMWGLGATATVQAQAIDQLAHVKNIFYHRLETTCRYQEDLLPAGVVKVKRYLQLGKRRNLIESVVDNGRTLIKEEYWFPAEDINTVPQAGKARYELVKGIPYQQGQMRLSWYHDYLSFMNVDAGSVALYQEFSPAAVLALRPDTARTGQTLYVLNRLPDLTGDTLACYEITRSRTGDTCTMVLRMRATQAKRKWHHNTQVVCVWEADRTKREVAATRFVKDEPGSSHWVRTYMTGDFNNFTEIQYNSWPAGHAQLRRRYTYRRRFQQLSAQQSLDTYTVLTSRGTTESTFTITSYYSYGKHSRN